ncbi:Late embryogenesis abundant protein Lea5-D [Linum grandiflorum]
MATSVAISKLLPASISIIRRGYAATTAPLGGAAARGRPAGKVVKEEKSAAANKGSESSWAPDPVTGYYRPGNSNDEIDPVELREMLLKNRFKN